MKILLNIALLNASLAGLILSVALLIGGIGVFMLAWEDFKNDL